MLYVHTQQNMHKVTTQNVKYVTFKDYTSKSILMLQRFQKICQSQNNKTVYHKLKPNPTTCM